jgi:hypothetical protein
MKTLLPAWFVIAISLAFLTNYPKAKAFACADANCEGLACYYTGDITCNNGQYLYPATGGTCTLNCPLNCSCGSGGWQVHPTDQQTVCQSSGSGCKCPLSSSQWWVYSDDCH